MKVREERILQPIYTAANTFTFASFQILTAFRRPLHQRLNEILEKLMPDEATVTSKCAGERQHVRPPCFLLSTAVGIAAHSGGWTTHFVDSDGNGLRCTRVPGHQTPFRHAPVFLVGDTTSSISLDFPRWCSKGQTGFVKELALHLEGSDDGLPK